MQSLNPRYDLFRFCFPKDFLPKEVEEKYFHVLQRNNAIITTPIDYLNESIQGINIPGISDITIGQIQHSSNTIIPSNGKSSRSSGGFGKLNVEPKTDITYVTPENPLNKINKEFKVTLRLNEGLFNYFMVYETIFYRICKPYLYPNDDIFWIDILDDSTGTVIARISLTDVHIDGIDGLDFAYNKIERESSSFDITFKFNNIDFDFDKIDNLK